MEEGTEDIGTESTQWENANLGLNQANNKAPKFIIRGMPRLSVLHCAGFSINRAKTLPDV